MPVCVIKLCHLCFRRWLAAFSTPNHYLKLPISCQLALYQNTSMEFEQEKQNFNLHGKMSSENIGHFVQVLVCFHYGDLVMGRMASQITSLTIVYSTVYSSADQRKHQSSASLAFVRGIRRGPVNSPQKGQVTRKMCPFDDVIMYMRICSPLPPDRFSHELIKCRAL